MNIDSALIKLFNAIVPEGEAIEPRDVNRIAMQAGYLVEPAACTSHTLEAIKDFPVNYNSTFYKSFEEVSSHTRIELLCDQMLHYLTTYGTAFTAPAFTKNPSPAAMLYKELRVIRAVSDEDMAGMCLSALESGVAMKSEDVEAVCAFIVRHFNGSSDTAPLDIAAIPNREARAVLYILAGTRPTDPVEFLRTIVYAATGKAMLINSPETLGEIAEGISKKPSSLSFLGEPLDAPALESLAGIFFRFRHIFIAIKDGYRKLAAATDGQEREKALAAVSLINYLRRLAPRFKRPFKKDILSDITGSGASLGEIREAIASEPSAFRLIRILGYLKMKGGRPEAALYLIRNGRTFVKKNKPESFGPTAVEDLIPIVEDEIIRRLNVRGKTVRFPEHIDLAAPTSGKSFVGNIPFMSSCILGDENFIGVYWRNEWGARDFDLSAVFADADIKIGWNSDFKSADESVIFSGDMTNADPEASEILFFRKHTPDCFIYVNRYFGNPGAAFRLFIGRGKPEMGSADTPLRGNAFAVNAMDVRVEADATSNSAEQLVGYVQDGVFRFLTLGIGHRAASVRSTDYPLREALASRTHSAVSLKSLLLKAGAIELTDPAADADIDLGERKISATSITELFAPDGAPR